MGKSVVNTPASKIDLYFVISLYICSDSDSPKMISSQNKINYIFHHINMYHLNKLSILLPPLLLVSSTVLLCIWRAATRTHIAVALPGFTIRFRWFFYGQVHAFLWAVCLSWYLARIDLRCSSISTFAQCLSFGSPFYIIISCHAFFFFFFF